MFVYHLAIRLYIALIRLASLRSDKARRMIDGRCETWAYLNRFNATEGKGVVWIHAASLGEFEQGRPLIEYIRRDNPQQRILLTFFSPSGYDVRREYDQVDGVCYLPFDLPSNVRRFVDTVRPEKVIFIKYEFWAGYLAELHGRRIPTYIISAIFRPSQPFFRWYGGFWRTMLREYTHLYLQDEQSQALLAGIGITNTSVVGDTRMDRVVCIQQQAKPLPLVEAFVAGGAPVVVAGSSWSPDEILLTDYMKTHLGYKLIIAPHMIDEEHLAKIESALAPLVVARYSTATADKVAHAECLMIDCFGILSSVYRYGDIAYIGGGFGAGIHNLAEASVYHKPIVIGPRYHKFKEAIDLVALGGAFCITDEATLRATLDRLLADKEVYERAATTAGEYIHRNAGATEAIHAAVFCR